jgi:hypothetical protein
VACRGQRNVELKGNAGIIKSTLGYCAKLLSDFVLLSYDRFQHCPGEARLTGGSHVVEVYMRHSWVHSPRQQTHSLFLQDEAPATPGAGYAELGAAAVAVPVRTSTAQLLLLGACCGRCASGPI